MEAGGNSEMVYSPPLGDAEKRLSIVQCIIIGNFEKTGKPAKYWAFTVNETKHDT